MAGHLLNVAVALDINMDMCRLLVDSVADIRKTKYPDSNPLHFAVLTGLSKFRTEILIGRDAELLGAVNKKGFTPLSSGGT